MLLLIRTRHSSHIWATATPQWAQLCWAYRSYWVRIQLSIEFVSQHRTGNSPNMGQGGTGYHPGRCISPETGLMTASGHLVWFQSSCAYLHGSRAQNVPTKGIRQNETTFKKQHENSQANLRKPRKTAKKLTLRRREPGTPPGTRTRNPLIKSQLLCQLS